MLQATVPTNYLDHMPIVCQILEDSTIFWCFRVIMVSWRATQFRNSPIGIFGGVLVIVYDVGSGVSVEKCQGQQPWMFWIRSPLPCQIALTVVIGSHLLETIVTSLRNIYMCYRF